MGRCGDYVLRERPNVLRTFLYAPIEYRVEVAKASPEGRERSDPDKVIMQTLSKNDKKRASYYNYYTENRWGEAKNYDLCLNTQMGNAVCADLIVRAAQAMMEGAK